MIFLCREVPVHDTVPHLEHDLPCDLLITEKKYLLKTKIITTGLPVVMILN